MPEDPVASSATCGWTVDLEAAPGLRGHPAAVQQRAVTLATEILYGLTGRRYGACSVAVRPRLPGQADALGDTVYRGALAPFRGTLLGALASLVPCWCRGACRCVSTAAAIPLPGPVHQVSEVKVDGAVVPPTAYRVDNARWLVRTDGDLWPLWQDLTKPDTDAGTFLVTYTIGEPVPPGGAIAAGLLAAELAKALAGDATCRLPRKARTVSRQGTTVELDDPATLFKEGRTGVHEVDVWLQQNNPYKLAEPSRVFSPDRMQHRRTS
jgi:hypothetical protein